MLQYRDANRANQRKSVVLRQSQTTLGKIASYVALLRRRAWPCTIACPTLRGGVRELLLGDAGEYEILGLWLVGNGSALNFQLWIRSRYKMHARNRGGRRSGLEFGS